MSNLNLDQICRYLAGTADPETITFIESTLDEPETPVRDYCEWLRDPSEYLSKYGNPPAVVTEWLANLPAETRSRLDHIADDVPPENVDWFVWDRRTSKFALALALAVLLEHVAIGIWITRRGGLNAIQAPVPPVPVRAAGVLPVAIPKKPVVDSAELKRLLGYIDAKRITGGAFTGGYELAPRTSRINWYFANTGLVALAGKQPAEVRAYLDLFLSNADVDRMPNFIEDVQNIKDGTRQPPDSDAAYAATMLLLAHKYQVASNDNRWVMQNKERLKNIARRVIVGSQAPNGLCRGFVNSPDSPQQMMDNCEIYRGLADFGDMLMRVEDADAKEFITAADRVAKGVASLYDESEKRFHSANTGERRAFYPMNTAQVFPEIFGVPLGDEGETRMRYDAAWRFMNAKGDRWEDGKVSDGSLQGFPWMMLGYVAAKRGETELAKRQLRFFMNKVDAGWPFQLIHECGWAIRTIELLESQDQFN